MNWWNDTKICYEKIYPLDHRTWLLICKWHFFIPRDSLKMIITSKSSVNNCMLMLFISIMTFNIKSISIQFSFAACFFSIQNIIAAVAIFAWSPHCTRYFTYHHPSSETCKAHCAKRVILAKNLPLVLLISKLGNCPL